MTRKSASLLALLILLSVAPNARQESVTALVGATIIDGTGRPAFPATIVIRGQRIADIGTRPSVPTGATIIDLSGKRVVPGLVDMHGHMYARATAAMRSQFEADPSLYLAGGVTTVRSPGDFDPEGMIALRERIRRGEAVGPRIFVAGPYVDHASSERSPAACSRISWWFPDLSRPTSPRSARPRSFSRKAFATIQMCCAEAPRDGSSSAACGGRFRSSPCRSDYCAGARAE